MNITETVGTEDESVTGAFAINGSRLPKTEPLCTIDDDCVGAYAVCNRVLDGVMGVCRVVPREWSEDMCTDVFPAPCVAILESAGVALAAAVLPFAGLRWAQQRRRRLGE